MRSHHIDPTLLLNFRILTDPSVLVSIFSQQLSVRNHDTVPQTQFTVRNTSPEPELFTVRNTSATNLSVRKRISPPRKSPSDNLQVVISNSGREKFRSSGRLQLAGSLQQSPTTKVVSSPCSYCIPVARTEFWYHIHFNKCPYVVKFLWRGVCIRIKIFLVNFRILFYATHQGCY